MSSNIKPKGAAKEAPTEPFKRAVGICLKAIAGKGDLEVNSASERPGLVGGKARLPEPPRRLNEREAASFSICCSASRLTGRVASAEANRVSSRR